MTIELPQGRLLRLRQGAGNTLTMRRGSVWITEQGNPRDVLLRRGESFKVAQSGLVLVEALNDAALSLE
ncbi:MAG TPA: DUF2917 domain-containing protein [Burkholderiales bacterium]|jgi:hypothetical protein|nr:DUF2917 domain-containing protein [Burkholderiales bacterium]